MILPNKHFMKYNNRKSLFIVIFETIDESIEICAINYCCIFYHTNTKIHNYKTSYITVENKRCLSKVALHQQFDNMAEALDI